MTDRSWGGESPGTGLLQPASQEPRSSSGQVSVAGSLSPVSVGPHGSVPSSGLWAGDSTACTAQHAAVLKWMSAFLGKTQTKLLSQIKA